MRYSFLFAFILSVIFYDLSAQSVYSYGLTSYYGGVFRYKKPMAIFQPSNLLGMEASFSKQTTGNRYWEQQYHYPTIGLSATYIDYGIPDELGKVGAISGFIDFKLHSGNKGELRSSLGTGLVYSSLTYDPELNPNNKAIGSKVSYVLRANVYYALAVSEHWKLNLHAAFRHFSNGKMNMPNNGMNFPMLGLGATYTPEVAAAEREFAAAELIDRSLHVSVMGAMGWREVWYIDQKHKAYSGSLTLSQRLNWYSGLLLGVDGFYYSPLSIKRQQSPHGIILELDEIDGRLVGITLGHELYFGKLSLLSQAGFYVYNPHDLWASWYQNYALKYALNSHFFTQVSLISHLRTANLVAWGLGLRF